MIKNVYFYFASCFLAIFLISCSSETDSNNFSDSPLLNQTLVEYVWHKEGPNFSEDKLNMLVDEWNNIIDDAGYKMVGANILRPLEESDQVDFIWVLRWASLEDRNAAWEDWSQNYEPQWLETIDGVMTYNTDDVYLFKTSLGSSPAVENTEDTFVNSFFFCDYNDGYGLDDLNSYQEGINNVTWSDGHWYIMLEPQFDSGVDFVWLDLWSNFNDKDASREKWNQSEFPNLANMMFDCDEYGHLGKRIRISSN